MTAPVPLSHHDPATGEGRPLADHLRAVAGLSRGFAARLAAPFWAGAQGLAHDIGKAPEEWQDYLLNGADRVPHKMAGAVHATLSLGTMGLPIAYAIAAHHGGLMDWAPSGDGRPCLRDELPPTSGGSAERDRARAAATGPVEACLRRLPPGLVDLRAMVAAAGRDAAPPADPRFAVAFWIRMLTSALVDADRLDAEAFYDPDTAALRAAPRPSMRELKACFDAHMAGKAAGGGTGNRALHALRQELLASCRAAGALPPGLFAINGPTGLGKTLATLGFALEHAIAHGMERVVYVAPYLSVIDQTATVLGEVFAPLRKRHGGDFLLEHHSGTDPERETRANRLAAENWDAPIVVTTAVQLFESLYASSSTRLRKIHRLSGAVVILDEAQSVPTGCLGPIAHAIEQLVRQCGATVVLSTATQPGFDRAWPGMPERRDVVPDVARLHAAVRRFRLTRPNGWEETPLDEVAGWARDAGGSCLAIVDRRAQARELFEALRGEGCAFHLSTLMCPAHRRRRLAEIRARLKAGRRTLVAATRLVEAGVDVDFPLVVRAVAGLDSLIQAGGRCNREGLLESGELRVFKPEGWTPEGHMGMAAEVAMQVIDAFPDDPTCPAAVEAFFDRLHWRHGPDGLDAGGVLALLDVGPATLARPGRKPTLEYQFAEASRRFRMIDQVDVPVVVLWSAEGRKVIDDIRRGGTGRALLRRAGMHSASVPRGRIEDLVKAGVVEPTELGPYLQLDPAAYDDELGWVAL